MHKHGLCRHVVSLHPSITFVSCVKTNKDIFEIFPAILVFPRRTGWRYSNGNPPNGGIKCRWGRQKTRFWTSIWLHTGLQCCQLYESRSAKNKAATNGGKRRALTVVRRPLLAQDDDEVFVTGSTLYAGDEERSTPLVINAGFCCGKT